MNRRAIAPVAAAVLLVSTACSSADPTGADDPKTSAPTASPSGSVTEDDHGEIEGAQEVAEPPLHLLTIDDAGEVGLLDLLDETSTDLGRVSPPRTTATDGRYVFVSTPGGVEIVDSGMWTWDHGDHFHYYRSDPALLGTVPGAGAPTISTGALSTGGGTGVFFPDSGEAVLLDNAALSEGEPRELFRLEVAPHDGLVAPLGDGAVVTVPNDAGAVTSVRRHDSNGAVVAGSAVRCLDPRGSITTAVGLVIGCADGALLWTEEDDEWTAERIRYPARTDAPRATEFRAREGRPTVAALAGRTGIWLLDTRERTWELIDTGVPLRQVSAADDEEGHVLALDRTGRVRVYLAASGREVATSPRLVTSTRGVELVVDDARAYLNDPQEGLMYEIDYADRARVARELATPTGSDFFAEVGR